MTLVTQVQSMRQETPHTKSDALSILREQRKFFSNMLAERKRVQCTEHSNNAEHYVAKARAQYSDAIESIDKALHALRNNDFTAVAAHFKEEARHYETLQRYAQQEVRTEYDFASDFGCQASLYASVAKEYTTRAELQDSAHA